VKNGEKTVDGEFGFARAVVKVITVAFLDHGGDGSPAAEWRQIEWDAADGGPKCPRGALAFEFESRFGETIKAAPDQAVCDDDNRGERDSAGEEEIEILGIGGGGD
jgi:hypothetical protein